MGLPNTTIGQITATKTVSLQVMVCNMHKVLPLAGFRSIGLADADLAILFASLSTGYAIEHRLVVIKVSNHWTAAPRSSFGSCEPRCAPG
jgi:hypothetical protein